MRPRLAYTMQIQNITDILRLLRRSATTCPPCIHGNFYRINLSFPPSATLVRRQQRPLMRPPMRLYSHFATHPRVSVLRRERFCPGFVHMKSLHSTNVHAVGNSQSQRPDLGASSTERFAVCVTRTAPSIARHARADSRDPYARVPSRSGPASTASMQYWLAQPYGLREDAY